MRQKAILMWRVTESEEDQRVQDQIDSLQDFEKQEFNDEDEENVKDEESVKEATCENFVLNDIQNQLEVELEKKASKRRHKRRTLTRQDRRDIVKMSASGFGAAQIVTYFEQDRKKLIPKVTVYKILQRDQTCTNRIRDEIQDLAEEAFEKGVTIKEVAKMLNISISSAYRIRRNIQ